MKNYKDVNEVKRKINVLLYGVELTVIVIFFKQILSFLPPLDNAVAILIGLFIPSGLLFSINQGFVIPCILFIVKFLYGLFLRVIWVPNNDIKPIQEACTGWLMRQTARWGQYQRSINQKFEQTANVLLAVSEASPEIRKRYEATIKKGIRSLIDSITEKGVFDLSTKAYTNAIAAKVGYTILRMTKGKNVLGEADREKIDQLKHTFVKTYTGDGWGLMYNERSPQDNVRFMDSLLILLFLSQTDFSDSIDFTEMVRTIAEKSDRGKIGMCQNDCPKVITTSLLLLLLMSLKDDCRDELLSNGNIVDFDGAIEFIVSKLSRDTSLVEFDPCHGYNNHEKAAPEMNGQSYLATGWGIYIIAILKQHGYVGFYQKLQLINIIRRCNKQQLRDDQHNTKYFHVQSVGVTKKGPKNDFTSSYLMGINKFISTNEQSTGKGPIVFVLDILAAIFNLKGASMNKHRTRK